jgi:hypothetical protein
LQADRKLWQEIIALHTAGWSLDDALHEMTTVRADISVLLMPRPRPAKGQEKGNPPPPPPRRNPPPPAPRRDRGKGGRKGAPATGGKAGVRQQAPASRGPDLATTHAGKQICLRWNRQSCTSKSCKFAHVCGFKLPSGKACGERHPASRHSHATSATGSPNT